MSSLRSPYVAVAPTVEVAVDVATIFDTVVTAPGTVLVLAGTGNLAVQYVCAAGHGPSTDANEATLPEHDRAVAAYEVPPKASKESRTALEGLILG